MEQTGSKDLFVFYDLLLWGIKVQNLSFVIDQIDEAFPRIVYDCLSNRRIMERFQAFFSI